MKSKVNQMANTLNSYSAAYRDRLIGPDMKSDDVMKRASNMDNHGIVGFQRQIMRGMEEEAHIFISYAPLLFVILFMPHFNHSCVLFPEQNKMRALRNWRRQ